MRAERAGGRPGATPGDSDTVVRLGRNDAGHASAMLFGQGRLPGDEIAAQQ